MLERLVLKSPIQRTSQRVEWTCGALALALAALVIEHTFKVRTSRVGKGLLLLLLLLCE